MRLTPPHRLVPGVLTLLLVVAFPARTLVAGPKEPPSLTAKAPPPAAPEAGKQFAQAVSPTAGDLSAAAMVDLAGEYGWNEDSDTERKWLEAAVSLPPSPDVGRATVLLSEVTLFAGDRLKAGALLDQVRAWNQDPEIAALADLMQALAQLTPEGTAHDKKFYSEAEASRRLYAQAAEKWKGTSLGGWASIRLAAVYRNQLEQPEAAVAVLEQVVRDYTDDRLRGCATEDMAATVAFSLGRFAESRAMYEQLLATAASDFVKQRATLHLSEVLMDTEAYDPAYDLLTSFVGAWPEHARTVGARMLHGFVAAKLNLWDEAIADANDYLSRTAARYPAYVGKAHLVLGRAAFVQGQYDQAEREFALVNDEFLVQEATAGIGYSRAQRGDLRGAMTAFMQAAIGDRGCAPDYLYQAARLARELKDRATFALIMTQMKTEFPTSNYTTLLAGHEVAPAPGI